MRKRNSQGTAKKALAVLTTAALLSAGISISAPQAEAAAAKAKKLTVKPGSKTLYVGKYSPYKTTKLKAKVTPKKAKQKVKFKSLSKKVAKVSSKGKVTAKKKGTAKIKVTTVAKNKKGKKLSKIIKIKVKKYVAPTGITARISSSKLQVGKTAQITASLSGKPTCKTIVYTSSDKKVATVSSKGLVTAVAAGNATITAKSKVKGSKGKVLQKTFAITVTKAGGTTPKPPTPSKTDVSATAQIAPVKVENLPSLEDTKADITPTAMTLNTKNELSMADSNEGTTISMTMKINKLNASGNTYLWNTSGTNAYPMMFQAVTPSGQLYTELDWRSQFYTTDNFIPIGREFTLVTTYTDKEIRIYLDGELKAYYNVETGVSVGGSFSPNDNTALCPVNTTGYLATVRSSWTQYVLGVAPAIPGINLGNTVTDCEVKTFSIYKKALQPAPKDNKEKLIYPEEATYEISPDQDTVTFGGAILLNSTSNAKMTYTSSDSSIAGFTKEGKLRLLKVGQVTITAKTAGGVTASCKATINYSTIAIHDPSVFQDPVSGYYYTVGSHCLAGYSKDMKSWAWVANSSASYNASNKLFTKVYKEEFASVYAYVNPDDADPEGVWAPSIIYSKEAKKYFMYVTIASGGKQGKCAIVLTSSDKPDGPYKYEKMLVASGIEESTVDKTNLMEVLGITDKSQMPTKYKYNKNSDTQPYPDCIDATVFYDHTGKLWMTYGSFTCSGGIRMIQLDPKTGDRLKSATYEDNGTATALGDKDPYYGIKLANANGEGPFIMEVPSAKSSTGYYYFLWTSVGGLQSYGGYHMRMYRSENVEGPYVDTAGNNATSNLGRAELGLRVMDNYKFSFMDCAFTSCGGNSAVLANKKGSAENGKMFLHYHQKWADAAKQEGFVTKSNQMFLNEDGWLVTAPFAYDGESMNKTYKQEDVAGEYEFILHRTSYTRTDTVNYDYSDSVAVKLNADGTISGGQTGTWEFDKNYITIKIGKETYKGVVFEQNMEDKAHTKAMVFTAVGDGNIKSVWGVKALMGNDHYADLDQKKITVPTGENVTDTFNLPTTSARYGFDITWSSDKNTVTFEGGKATVKVTDAEQNVVITGTFRKGSYSKQYQWNMKVLSNKAYADLDKEKIEMPKGEIENDFTLPISSDKYGFGIVWSADKAAISFAGGAATISAGDTVQDVTITGTFSKGDYSTAYTWNVKVAAFRVPLNTIVVEDSITLPTEYKGKTVTWSSSDSSIINVSTGAVTRADAEDQTVTLTATVDGRQLTYEMTVKRKKPQYTQDYESVTNIDDVFSSTNLKDGRSIETVDGNKFFQFKQDGSSGNRGGMYTFGTPLVNAGSNYLVEFDLAITSGKEKDRSQSQVVLASTGTDAAIGNNGGASRGYVFKLSAGPLSTEWTINDSDATVVIAENIWVHVKAYVFGDGKTRVVITKGKEELYNGIVLANGDGSLTGLYILSGRNQGLTKIDNIAVY